MDIESVYEDESQIPDISIKELFQKDETGKLVLKGLKPESEIKKLEATVKATRAERDKVLSEHKSLLSGKTVDELIAELDELNLLRAEKETFKTKANESDEERNRKIQEMVELKTMEIKRKNSKLEETLAEISEKERNLNEWKRETLLSNEIGKAARSLGVVNTALEDVIEIGKRHLVIRDDGSISTKDNLMDVDEWVRSLEARSPHFFPQSQSGGAMGGAKGGTMKIDGNKVHDPRAILEHLNKGGKIHTTY